MLLLPGVAPLSLPARGINDLAVIVVDTKMQVRAAGVARITTGGNDLASCYYLADLNGKCT